ncbi:FliH/SctL family protein [Microvirga massiliensis]|uniref:FliH/SctL family protein n=1 Tax=Microvirga massiliensis TaxID=1033741 RepID=UPI0006612F05|nr:FliH/SctL family protein [Microvirga massiliensis]
MTINVKPFLFGNDFRQRPPEPKPDTRHEEAIAEAEARGYMRGLAEGRQHVETEAELRVAAALESLATGIGAIMASLDSRHSETESLAIEFALALARKLAGDALAREPLAAIEAAAHQCLQHLRGVPHLVARVEPSLVERVDELLRRLARERGFDGKIVTLGDPDIPAGDVRLEWADGGVARDRSRIEAAAAEMLGRALHRPL